MMPGRGIRSCIAVAALGLAMIFSPIAGEAAQSAAQNRGKQIYLKGASPSGDDIMAIVGTEGITLPASAVPCASCHGPDGLGRPEGGVLPPDIRWSELTKTYGHIHQDGRRHPAFDQLSLARLLRSGLDPADNRLDRSMPLYAMSDEDMDDLVAYLRHLEVDWDPGVDNDRIQIATLLPLQGPQGALGRAMAQVMHAYFQELNKQGGIFGRRLELLAIPYGSTHQETLDNLRRAFEEEGIFALVGAYTVGLDDEILDLLRAREAPLIGPFTLNPGDEIINAATFYIYPGFNEQVRVLAGQALEDRTDGESPLVLVGPEGEHVDRLIAVVRDQVGGGNAIAPLTARYHRGELDAYDLAERVQNSGSDAMLFFGDQSELEPLLKALDQRKQSPRIYLLSAFVPRPLFDSPVAFHHRIFLAYPTLSSDVSASGRADYQRLAQTHALPPDHLQGQVAAFAAAKLLVEGLRGAGRSLNRPGLVEAIEALYRYDTGLTPPLTYGPNRRIGARGAHVMAVDLMEKSNAPVGEWHEVR